MADIGELQDGEKVDKDELKEEAGSVNSKAKILVKGIKELGAFAYSANVGRALADLLRNVACLHLSRFTDEEDEESKYSSKVKKEKEIKETFTMTVLDPVRKHFRKHYESSDLLNLLAMHLGAVKVKQCRGSCKEFKPLEMFSFKKDSRDKRNNRCKKCEAQRKAEWKAEKGGARATVDTEPKDGPRYKKCRRCGRGRLRDAYKKDKSRPDGLWPYCKGCERKRRKGKG